MDASALRHLSHGTDCAAREDGSFAIRLRTARGACDSAAVLYTFNKYEWHRGRSRAAMLACSARARSRAADA